jgi:hypothetical protein
MITMPRTDPDRRSINPSFIPPPIAGYVWRYNDSTSPTALAAKERAERSLPERTVVLVTAWAPSPHSDVKWAIYHKIGTFS